MSCEPGAKLREHIEAARIQAFAEAAQVLETRYRKAFAEFATAATAATDPAGCRREFLIMDTWCRALHAVQAMKQASIDAVTPSTNSALVLQAGEHAGVNLRRAGGLPPEAAARRSNDAERST